MVCWGPLCFRDCLSAWLVSPLARLPPQYQELAELLDQVNLIQMEKGDEWKTVIQYTGQSLLGDAVWSLKRP